MDPERMNNSRALASSLHDLTSPGSLMNASTSFNSVVEYTLLTEINREKRIILIPVIVYTILTLVIGIVGNPVAVYIYGFKWPDTTTRWFLLWLAFIDILSCITTVPTEIYFLFYYYYLPNGTFCGIIRFLTFCLTISSALVFVAIAVDRYVRICHPFRLPLSNFGARITCIASLLIGVALSWPALLIYGRRSIRIPMDQGYILGFMCSVRNDMDDTVYPQVFLISLYCGLSVCFLILCVLYILIGRAMLERRRAEERRNSMFLRSSRFTSDVTKTVPGMVFNEQPTGAVLLNQIVSDDKEGAKTTSSMVFTEQPTGGALLNQIVTESKDETKRSSKSIKPSKTTVMVSAITIVFVVSFLPFLIVRIIRQNSGPSFYPSLTPAQDIVVNIFYRSYLVNSCADPVIYGLLNSLFNAEVRNILRLIKIKC